MKLVPPKHAVPKQDAPKAVAAKPEAPKPESRSNPTPAAAAEASAPAPSKAPGIVGAMVAAAGNAVVPAAKAEDAPPRHVTRGGWVIQVGAFEDESEAKERLASAQSKAARLLGKANRYTERTTKGE